MRIVEYFIYGLVFAVFGGVFIGAAATSDAKGSDELVLIGLGALLSAVGSIFTMIGVVAKGVEVGTR